MISSINSNNYYINTKANRADSKYLISSKGDEVYFEKGKAYTKDGKPFDDSFYYQTSPNETYKISYMDGDLLSSSKNGIMYKFYHPGMYNINHKFKDDSEIPYNHLWQIDEEKDENAARSVIDYEEGVIHSFVKNDKNSFCNEPKIFAHMYHPISKKDEVKINKVALNDIEDIEFESVEEAEEYFMEKYGIDAEFENIFQAQITKQAVDAFTPYNYKGKGERLFEGLQIRSADLKEDAKMAENRSIVGEQALVFNINNTSIDDFLGFLKEYEGAPLSELQSSAILFNSTYNDWTGRTFQENYRTNFHPNKFFSGVLVHELTHWLHMNYETEIATYARHCPLSQKEKEIMSKVSRYGTTSVDEFIAEYVAGRMEGKTYPDDVNEFYKKLKGPDLFND